MANRIRDTLQVVSDAEDLEVAIACRIFTVRLAEFTPIVKIATSSTVPLIHARFGTKSETLRASPRYPDTKHHTV